MIKAIFNGPNVVIMNSDGKKIQTINLVKNPSVKALLTGLSEEGLVEMSEAHVSSENSIIAAREKAGLTSEQLADLLGITRQGMFKIETRRSMPRLDLAIKLSELLDLDIKEFL